MVNFLQTNQRSATIAARVKPGQWPTYSKDREEPERARRRQEKRHEAGRIRVTREDEVTGRDAQDTGAHTGKVAAGIRKSPPGCERIRTASAQDERIMETGLESQDAWA